MSSDLRDGPMRHFRVDRRALLQSLAGAAVFTTSTSASAQHVHAAAAVAAQPEVGNGTLLFLDQHAFDTLATLSEQIVPGARAAQVPEFLDRLLAVESTATQKRAMQALGAFEREARATHGVAWKTLSAEQANALLTKISAHPETNPSRQAFDDIKGAVAESYYSTEVGMKELGWDGSMTFAPPAACQV